MNTNHPVKVNRIRPLALGLIRNAAGQFLFHQAHDRRKGETFYRPLGGGIEFGETGRVALSREFQEEIGQHVNVGRLLHTFENIFEFEGHAGHEIVLLYDVEFSDSSATLKDQYSILERGAEVGKAVWRTPREIHFEKAKLYPLGLDQLLTSEVQFEAGGPS